MLRNHGKYGENESTWLYEKETIREFPSHLNPLIVLLETAYNSPLWVPRATYKYYPMLSKCENLKPEYNLIMTMRDTQATVANKEEGDGTARVVTVHDKNELAHQIDVHSIKHEKTEKGRNSKPALRDMDQYLDDDWTVQPNPGYLEG